MTTGDPEASTASAAGLVWRFGGTYHMYDKHAG